MSDSQPSKCSSCDAEIHWAMTTNGKKQPFDAKPQKVWLLAATGSGLRVEGQRNGYTPHHVTCPSVDEHRKKK